MFDCLTAWLAPILCFTAEEAWWARWQAAGEGGDDQAAAREESVHLRTFPEIPAEWHEAALANRWSKLREVRRTVTGALELERAEKRIGSSLQASPRIFVDDPDLMTALEGLDLAEIAITSNAEAVASPAPENAFKLDEVPAVGVVPDLAEGEKCQRCWRILPEVRTLGGETGLCVRCDDAIQSLDDAAE